MNMNVCTSEKAGLLYKVSQFSPRRACCSVYACLIFSGSLVCAVCIPCVTTLVLLTTLMNVSIFHSVLGTVYSFSSCYTFTEVDVTSSYTQKPTAGPLYMPFESGTYMLQMFIGGLIYWYI